MEIRPATVADAEALCAIYNPFVRTTTITFEEASVSPAEMTRRIREVQAWGPWLVGQEDEAVIGYAYATPWRTRSAYRFSAETTVYVAPQHGRKGVGKGLYLRLLADLKTQGIHAVMGGIALPNAASVALHEALGFQKVAHFSQVGRKFDTWVDVGYWQLLL